MRRTVYVFALPTDDPDESRIEDDITPLLPVRDGLRLVRVGTRFGAPPLILRPRDRLIQVIETKNGVCTLSLILDDLSEAGADLVRVLSAVSAPFLYACWTCLGYGLGGEACLNGGGVVACRCCGGRGHHLDAPCPSPETVPYGGGHELSRFV